MQKYIEFALTRLSRGDRKRLSIYKDVSQMQGRQIYKILFDKNIIKEEISREKPYKTPAKKTIKKEFRRYQIDNKIHFANESTRFWFNFIAPNEKYIKNLQFQKVLEEINLHLEKHISLSFEILCEELLKKILSQDSILSSGSFWSKDSEIDLLIQTKDQMTIVGEVKWRSKKICKNVLNSLIKKANKASLEATHFALFSKSGFSKEVQNLQNEFIMLFNLDDFKRLYDD